MKNTEQILRYWSLTSAAVNLIAADLHMPIATGPTTWWTQQNTTACKAGCWLGCFKWSTSGWVTGKTIAYEETQYVISLNHNIYIALKRFITIMSSFEQTIKLWLQEKVRTIISNLTLFLAPNWHSRVGNWRFHVQLFKVVYFRN